MNQLNQLLTRSLAVFLLAFGFMACDSAEDLEGLDLLDEDGQEVVGTIEALTDTSVTVDGLEYAVNDDTEFEGIDGLASLAVGDVIEIEYEEDNGSRTALYIELDDGSGDDDDD